jgi:hypothetical protein
MTVDMHRHPFRQELEEVSVGGPGAKCVCVCVGSDAGLMTVVVDMHRHLFHIFVCVDMDASLMTVDMHHHPFRMDSAEVTLQGKVMAAVCFLLS